MEKSSPTLRLELFLLRLPRLLTEPGEGAVTSIVDIVIVDVSYLLKVGV